jgi:hypothetical protein
MRESLKSNTLKIRHIWGDSREQHAFRDQQILRFEPVSVSTERISKRDVAGLLACNLIGRTADDYNVVCIDGRIVGLGPTGRE